MNHNTTERRKKLWNELTIPYVVVAFDAMQQTNDAAAPFVQEANFFYLTGITEPGWVLFVNPKGEEYLIAPDVSEVHRVFDGGLSNDQASAISGVEQVLDKKSGYRLIRDTATASVSFGVVGRDPYRAHFSFVENPSIRRMTTYIHKYTKNSTDIRPTIAKMRGIKNPDEVRLIRQAIAITLDAFTVVKNNLQSAGHEHSLEADFTYTFRHRGAHHAYDPIIAAGGNACTLHYQKNESELPKNGLVLMDVGAKVGGYAADITRTYAIGTPSEREVAVHQAVEKAHYAIISLLKPNLSIKSYHEAVDVIMKTALDELGLLQKPSDYRIYFPHAISHGLGIDVHDSLGGPKTFQPGMVLTVEPGVYIPEEGIGIRIEDDILITDTGHENLSAGLATSL